MRVIKRIPSQNDKSNPFVMHSAIIGIVTVFTILITVILHRQEKILQHDNEMVMHTQIVLNQAQTLLAGIEDAELGQRGYIITGNPEFLEPYNSALGNTTGGLQSDVLKQDGSIFQRIETLRTLTADNLAQQRKLDELDVDIKELIKYLTSTIKMDKPGIASADLKKLDPNYGKQVMDGIRQEITTIIAEENRLLVVRSEEDKKDTKLSNLMLFSSIALLYVCILSIIWVIARKNANPSTRC